MKKDGINNTLQFILKDTTPIYELGQKSTIEESDKKLLKGTIIDGQLKTRIINVDGERVPFKFIQLKDKKGYISPQVVNLYIGKFANFEEAEKSEEITDADKPYQKPKRAKNIIINYGLPLAGLGLGYYVAKKTEADEKKMIGYILFFGLLGILPRYLYNK
jgi:hypothetical protein